MTVTNPSHPYHAERRRVAIARWRLMLAMRRKGSKFREIARHFGISTAAAFDRVTKAESFEHEMQTNQKP